MIEAYLQRKEGKTARFKLYVAGLAMVIVLLVILFFANEKINEKRDFERKILGMEVAVNGTPIMTTREAVKESIASGRPEITKDEVLYGKTGQDYVCTIETDKGIITLKKRGDLMREEMVREKIYNTSVIFLSDSLYIFHPQYNMWAKFDYNPGMKLSDTTYLYSAYSYSELTNINATDYHCIQMDMPANEFSLEEYPIFEAQEYLRNMSILGRRQ